MAAAVDHGSLWDGVERFARVGTWEWSPDRDELVWSENLFRLVGYEPGEIIPSTAHLLEHVHPEDVTGVQRELDAARRGGGLPPMQFRVILEGGALRHMETAQTLEHLGSEPAERRLFGFARDVSEEHVADRALAVSAAVARSLSKWESTEAGAERLLRELTHATGAAGAVLWVPEEGRLVPAGCWCAPPLDPARFAPTLGKRRPIRGAGLVGRAWQRAEPLLRASAPDASAGAAADGTGAVHASVAIPAVHRGEVWAVLAIYAAEPMAADGRLLDAFADVGSQLGAFFARRPGMQAPLVLTARELEVLRLAADGLPGQKIQERLSVSQSTVKSHLEHIYDKLGVSNRVAAVACALRHGLIE